MSHKDEPINQPTQDTNESDVSDSRANFVEAMMQSLCEALSMAYLPLVANSKQHLLELLQKQDVLLDALHEENLKLSWTQNSVELHKMFDVIGTYHNKLTAIKRDMKLLHEKNNKLKKRAHRLQEYKEKLESIQKLTKELQLDSQPSNSNS